MPVHIRPARRYSDWLRGWDEAEQLDFEELAQSMT